MEDATVVVRVLDTVRNGLCRRRRSWFDAIFTAFNDHFLVYVRIAVFSNYIRKIFPVYTFPDASSICLSDFSFAFEIAVDSFVTDFNGSVWAVPAWLCLWWWKHRNVCNWITSGRAKSLRLFAIVADNVFDVNSGIAGGGGGINANICSSNSSEQFVSSALEFSDVKSGVEINDCSLGNLIVNCRKYWFWYKFDTFGTAFDDAVTVAIVAAAAAEDDDDGGRINVKLLRLNNLLLLLLHMASLHWYILFNATAVGLCSSPVSII